jgi:uncharacterized protein with PQ loop repeat
MEFLTILGLTAATITTSAFLPQMIKTWQSKSAKDVSYTMLITFIIGIFFVVSLWSFTSGCSNHTGKFSYFSF